MNPQHSKLFANWRWAQAITAFIKLVLMIGLTVSAWIQPAQAVPPPLTLVSLTFDDGLTQSPAHDLLASHGLHGTFYVNSDLINVGSYLKKFELDALYADGNEIGGHTIGHANLATLSDAAQQTAICNDMQNLVNWGYDIHSFAYPYGATGPNTRGIVAAGCPEVGAYESARGVGGLFSGTECLNCPLSEAIPSGNPYHISTNKSVDTTTTLDDLKGYVTQAENSGGGWVVLMFHRICDACVPLSVSQATLDAFFSWLDGRQLQNTYVRTVHQVMSGDHPPLTQPALSTNVLFNPSLEDDANGDNKADCWDRDGYGVNGSTWTRTSDAHTGSFADRLEITSFTSGDRKLLPAMDAGQPTGCAPAVTPGELYQLGIWYKSDVPAFPVLFYLDANDVWQYWRDGPQVAAAADWTQMSYAPPAIPNGAKAISFGLALERVGTLTTDDYSMYLVQEGTAPPDTTPPVITGFAPADGTAVTGVVPLTASVTDNVAVDQVEFMIDGAVVGTDKTRPFAVSWDSKTAANGPVAYSVRAVDFGQNPAVSATNQLTVFNDSTPPEVSWTQPPSPAEGDLVAGMVPLEVAATDDGGVTRVDFVVNGSVVGTASAEPYLINWNSLLNADGPTTVTAKAFDAAGNSTQTPVFNVIVNNYEGNLLTNPSLEIDADNDNIADCWQRAGFGSNTFKWSRVTGAAVHSGNFASSLTLTSRTSGDRKLVPTLDASACAPAVTVGARYTLSAWYQSTTATGFVVYYRNSAGTWVYWKSSPIVPASSNWAQASYTTPPIPAGATAISFGLYLNNVGTLVTDDYGMALVQ